MYLPKTMLCHICLNDVTIIPEPRKECTLLTTIWCILQQCGHLVPIWRKGVDGQDVYALDSLFICAAKLALTRESSSSHTAYIYDDLIWAMCCNVVRVFPAFLIQCFQPRRASHCWNFTYTTARNCFDNQTVEAWKCGRILGKSIGAASIRYGRWERSGSTEWDIWPLLIQKNRSISVVFTIFEWFSWSNLL